MTFYSHWTFHLIPLLSIVQCFNIILELNQNVLTNAKFKNIIPLNNANIVVINSKWHSEYTNKMLECFSKLISEMGNNTITTYTVSGCWEIPQFLSILLSKNKDKKDSKNDATKIDAVVLFGVLFKGDTYHFDMILNTLSSSLAKILIKSRVPIINEILPVSNFNQLEERCGDNEKNKGYEAAIAVSEMIRLVKSI